MKLNHKINISMEVFLKSGKFDCLEIGQTQEWILNNFPDPDDWSALSKSFEKASIWKYGDVELHFTDGKLSMIFSDHFSSVPVQGGKSLNIEPWIIWTKLTLGNFINLQLIEKFNFYVEPNRYDLNEDFIIITLDSGVELTFTGIENDDVSQCKLSSFSYRGKRRL